MDLMRETQIDQRPFDIQSIEKEIVTAAYDAVEAYYSDSERLKMRMEKLSKALRLHREKKYK